MKQFSILALALFGGLHAPGTAAAQQAVATRAGAISRELALATFDSAWSRINTTHYDTAFAGVDWPSVRDDLRIEAGRVESLGELRDVLRRMLARLGESHYTLIPSEVVNAVTPERADAPEGGEPGDLGMELTLVEGGLVVWRVDPSGPAARSGVKSGWRLRSIDGYEPDEALRRISRLESGRERRNALTQFLFGARGRTEGPAGGVASLEFRDGGDRPVALSVTRRERPGLPVRFGALPTFFARVEHSRVPNGGSCVGVIRLNVWMAPLAPDFDRAVDDVRDCRGIVLDLRGNPGGVAGMVMGIAGHFLNDRIALGTMRSRGSSLDFVANPRRVDTSARPVEPFDGPLAIVIDAMSVSTTEIFAGGMQAIGRARVFGETSAGQALPAGLYRLPDGDVLMHVLADFTAAGGNRIEGRGVIPDKVVVPSRDELLAGRDPALDAALAWIRNRPVSDRW